MNRKATITGFFMIFTIRIVMAAIGLIFIVMVLFRLFSGGDAAIPSQSQKSFEDLVVKLDRLEDGGAPVISFGTLDKDFKIETFDSDWTYSGPGDRIRPNTCGSSSNSCICICKPDCKGSEFQCRGFSSNKIKKFEPVIAYVDSELKEHQQFKVELVLTNKRVSIFSIQ